MRLFEATLFWNETHYFQERVANTLRYADTLVISESEDSYSLKSSRSFIVPGLIEKLPSELRSRVLFVPVDFKPLGDCTHWAREIFARQSGFQYLKAHRLITPDDILLVQDFDEFFDPKYKSDLLRHFRFPWRVPIHPRYRLTYYYLDLLSDSDWTLPVAFRASLGMKRNDFSIHQLRTEKKKCISRDYWGWHHSYLGNFDFIKNKILAFSHADDARIQRTSDEDIRQRLAAHEDLFGRKTKFNLIENYAEIGIPDLANRHDLMKNHPH